MLVHSGQVHAPLDCSAGDGPRLRGKMDQSISKRRLNNLVLLPLPPRVDHPAQRLRAWRHFPRASLCRLPAIQYPPKKNWTFTVRNAQSIWDFVISATSSAGSDNKYQAGTTNCYSLSGAVINHRFRPMTDAQKKRFADLRSMPPMLGPRLCPKRLDNPAGYNQPGDTQCFSVYQRMVSSRCGLGVAPEVLFDEPTHSPFF